MELPHSPDGNSYPEAPRDYSPVEGDLIAFVGKHRTRVSKVLQVDHESGRITLLSQEGDVDGFPQWSTMSLKRLGCLAQSGGLRVKADQMRIDLVNKFIRSLGRGEEGE
jgi:hypothetical protein